MSTSLHNIDTLMVNLEKTIGFPLGWKAYDREDGKRVLVITGENSGKDFRHESEGRSEFKGYLRGIMDGYNFCKKFPLNAAYRSLRIFCTKAKALTEATDQDIFTDAPECKEAVREVSKTSADLWAHIQNMPAHIREPNPEALEDVRKSEALREKELEAIQCAADFLDRTIGADEVQCDLNSEVEFVDEGAWVSVRVFVSPDSVFDDESELQKKYRLKCEAEFEGEACLKPTGHEEPHVSLNANW